MRKLVWIALLSMTTLRAVPAPSPPSPGAASSPASEVVTAAEDVAVLKAFSSLRLSRSQLAELLPVLQGAQSKLTDLETRLEAKLTAQRTALEQARRDLLAGKSSGSRAEEQFLLAQSAAAQQRAGLRADLVASLRRSLSKILSPQQLQQIVEGGQLAVITQRMGGRFGPGGDGRFGPGGGGRFGPGGPSAEGRTGGERSRGDGQGAREAGGPRGDGGPGGLDRIRGMSEAEFQESMQLRAERFGGQNSPQFQQYLALMNQVRGMPDAQFQVQRDRLMAQMMLQVRGGAGFGMAGNDEEAANTFVDRYLLSVRAPVVAGERLQTR